VVHELTAVPSADAIVVDETITHHGPILRGLDRLGPGGSYSGFVGGLGTGLGTALGVKAAHPQRSVICTIADGSFNDNPVTPSLGYAQEHRAPIMIVLFNNLGHLSQQSEIPKYYPGGYAERAGNYSGTSIQPAVEYAALAPIFGGYGETVNEPSEVRNALQRGFARLAQGQTVLLDMRLVPVPS
jgi:acetolactate synthase-1/2/3 large subunit